MPTQLIFTPLPNGVGTGGVHVDGEHLRLSVHIAPRLTASGSQFLDAFPLMVDWPAALAQAKLIVTVDGIAHEAFVASTTSSAHWTALFPGDKTGVESFVPKDFSDAPVHSFPAAAVEDFLAGQYGRFGLSSGAEYPSSTQLLDDNALGPIRFTGRVGMMERDGILEELLDERTSLKHNPSSATSLDPRREILQVLDFHKPPTDAVLPEIPLIEIDFHKAVTFLQGYPSVLRTLGLVVDVEVPISRGVPLGVVGTQVDVDWTELAPPLAAPTMTRPVMATLYDPGAGQFEAQPSTLAGQLDLRVVDGALPFDDPSRYQVVRVDTDGGAEKLSDLAGNVHQATKEHPTVDTPDDYALPSLRSGGVAVARVGMGAQLHESTVRSQALEVVVGGSGDPGLFAEDVTRGVRIDVFDVDSGRWFPLCGRTGTVQIATEEAVPEDVEGWVSVAPTSAVDDSTADLYLPETLFHWDGWSLVVERPGAQLTNRPDGAGNAVPGETPEPNAALARDTNAPHPDIDLTHRFTVPNGSLPRLRFGRRYRIRARIVDLAGNGPGFGDPSSTDFTHATPEFEYLRFEPVQSPPVHLRAPTLPAEEVDRVVVRTDNETGAMTVPTSDRHIAPPKSGQYENEVLGLCDLAGGGLDGSLYPTLAARDPLGVNHPSNQPQPDTRFAVTGDDGGVFWFDVPELGVEYLPDGLAKFAALTYASGPNAGQFLLVDFPGTWPDRRAFRIRAVEGNGVASLVVDDATERVVEVPLRQADIVDLRVSTAFARGDEDLLAVWDWTERYANSIGANLTAVRDLAHTGRHWMLSPYRTLTLVHAVKQPLTTAEFAQLTTARLEGETFARLRGQLTLDRPSTQRIDVVAEWTDAVDLGAPAPPAPSPTTPDPYSQPVGEVVACSFDYEHGENAPGPITFEGRHEFHDTKRRDITYRLRSVSRFPEYFAETTSFPAPMPGNLVAVDAAGIAPGTTSLHAPDGVIDPDLYVIDPVAGTLSFPVTDPEPSPAPPPGTPLELRYVPGSITRDGAVVNHVVQSSARPLAPSVHYVIPTFGWETSRSTTATTSTRRGGGLRVYLDRPWWSSGRGELLGVVTFPAGESGGDDPDLVPEGLSAFVTQWANDPIYDGPDLPSRHPRMASFPDAVETRTGLLLAERPVQVNVAGHQVDFDPERKLWFCDLTVDCGSAYNPMIRLALARFQPESIQGVHLSPVVLAEFSQLAPDRFTTISPGRGRSVNVAVSGPSYTATEGDQARGKVFVQLEEREQTWGDDTVGWRPVGPAKGLRRVLVRTAHPTWTGNVQLPKTTKALRLVVTQYETFRTDDRGPSNRSGRTIGHRPVYVDILPLD